MVKAASRSRRHTRGEPRRQIEINLVLSIMTDSEPLLFGRPTGRFDRALHRSVVLALWQHRRHGTDQTTVKRQPILNCPCEIK